MTDPTTTINHSRPKSQTEFTDESGLSAKGGPKADYGGAESILFRPLHRSEVEIRQGRIAGGDFQDKR
jgi:hypothetical protein